MKITRSDILKAIRTEPLKAGHWVDNASNGNSKCKVCALGAVLRQQGFEDWDIPSEASKCVMLNSFGFNAEHDLEQALVSEKYLNALSIKFERLANRLGAGKRTRRQLATFVKKNFPKVIVVNE